jgi:rhodanese-related sulfurtransferase
VSDDLKQPAPRGRSRLVRDVGLETVWVLVVGAGVAFAANALSPRGLMLARNYFPAGPTNTMTRAVTAPVLTLAGGSNQLSGAELLAAQLRAKGLQVVDRDEAVRRFRDPRFLEERVVFVDARDEEHYEAGHVPGAWEFDPYRPEKQFAAVLPVCQAADEVVIYCNGGDCEDSQFAALALRDAGVPNGKLWIYPGGFQEWTTNGLPVETGGRNSGILLPSTK